MGIARSIRMIRRLYLALGTLAMMFGGVMYTWSILKNPLAEAFGWTPTQLALNHTLTMVFVAAGNLLAGLLARRLSARWLMCGSGALVFLGFLGTATMSGTQILWLYVCNAGLCGMGIGAFLVSVINTMGKWYPDKRGTCTSVLQMGFGFGGLLLGVVIGYLLEMPGFGWRNTHLVLGIGVGIAMAAAGLIIHPPVRALGTVQARVTTGSPTSLKPVEMLRQRTFWRYYLFNLFVGTIGSVIINFSTDFFGLFAIPATLVVLMAGLVSVSNGLGRFCIGLVFDRWGSFSTVLTIAVLAVASPLFLLLSLSQGWLAAGVAGACLGGFTYGCIPSAASPVIRTRYGDVYFAFNYSICLTNSMPASFMATAAGAILTAGGSFVTVFLLLLVFSLAAAALGITLRRSI